MNIFSIPKLPSQQEQIDILHQDRGIRIERIVSTGSVSDWYDQDEAEYVILLEGNAMIEFEDYSRKEMSKGDTLFIAPHVRHKLSYTSKDPPCIWLCVFYRTGSK